MKKFAIFLVMIFVCPFFFLGCGKNEGKRLNNYDIFIDYDASSHSAECFEKVTYENVSDNVLEKICFHLYPKAFRENAKSKVVSLAMEDKAYPNGKDYGDVLIQSVKIYFMTIVLQL